MSLCINPNCKSPNPDDTLFCYKCGSELLLAGRYKVVKLLSDKGGFANTYEVMHQGVPKVMKMLKQQSQKAMELFEREFEVLKQSNHPGIPKAEDYFNFVPKHSQTQTPLYCLVMEKIFGTDLEEYIKQTGRPIDQRCALEWLFQLAHILEEIHHKQLLHRDIKPSNIILQPDGQLVLIDFGAVKQIASIQAGGQNTWIFTPGYAAPEQEYGSPVVQSDFFALGRTFTYLLTGKEPKTLVNPNTNEVNWHPHISNVSPMLVEFIDRLMEHPVEKRPPNAQAILSQLTTIQNTLYPPVPISDPTASKSANPPPSGSRNSWKFIIPLALLLLGGAVWGIMWFRNPASQSANNSGTQGANLPPTNSESKCSTSNLVKKSGNLYGVIEIGSKGIKSEVIQELATPNEDGLTLIARNEEIEDRNTAPREPKAQTETVSAVKDVFGEIQQRFQIPCEQIVIYGSSGLAKAPHKDALAKDIQEQTGRSVNFISDEEEATLVFDGIVPQWRRNEVVTIDIGSGNIKGAYVEDIQTDKHGTFAIDLGTTAFTEKINAKRGEGSFVTAAANAKRDLLVPEIREFIQRKPAFQTLPRVYLGGGISWALFTLVRPCQAEQAIKTKEERVALYGRIYPEDINTFYNNATRDRNALFQPDLSQCKTPEQRQQAEKDINTLKSGKVFSIDNLIAGAEILRAFSDELNFSQRERIFFSRYAKDALPIGYLKQQLKNAN
ncbi:MAG: protein kinase [Cyanosarcina radialis HA8281-LM2]|jgi:serine/threonine protein kinase|nr:protein kinase [Cyanosarcina radialis HA8281-LM2]